MLIKERFHLFMFPRLFVMFLAQSGLLLDFFYRDRSSIPGRDPFRQPPKKLRSMGRCPIIISVDRFRLIAGIRNFCNLPNRYPWKEILKMTEDTVRRLEQLDQDFG